jgi:indole-3-glycerol phosphate synthase
MTTKSKLLGFHAELVGHSAIKKSTENTVTSFSSTPSDMERFRVALDDAKTISSLPPIDINGVSISGRTAEEELRRFHAALKDAELVGIKLPKIRLGIC